MRQADRRPNLFRVQFVPPTDFFVPLKKHMLDKMRNSVYFFYFHIVSRCLPILRLRLTLGNQSFRQLLFIPFESVLYWYNYYTPLSYILLDVNLYWFVPIRLKFSLYLAYQAEYTNTCNIFVFKNVWQGTLVYGVKFDKIRSVYDFLYTPSSSSIIQPHNCHCQPTTDIWQAQGRPP